MRPKKQTPIRWVYPSHRIDLTQPRIPEVMFDLSWPSEAGQENVTSKSSISKRRRSDALKLSHEEAKAVRVAVRKLKRVYGSFGALAVATEIPANTLRSVANPKGIAPTGTFAIRLAAIAVGA